MRGIRCLVTLGACIGLTLGVARIAAADCGDGVTTVGEACDNGTPVCVGGKNPGAECCTTADCTGGGTCTGTGSSRVGTAGNRNDVANACRCNCMLPMCGDGVSDAGEQCDPGSSTSLNGPCLGSVANSVCSAKAVPGLVLNNPFIAGATVKCANDADCFLFGGAAECKGNPACHLNVCGDSEVCSDANCTSGNFSLLSSSPGLPGPEACDDGNTSNMDSCTSFNFSALVATVSVPDRCQLNVCGDGVSNMGVEQCDLGVAVCITGSKVGKPCCISADCTVGNISGVCSSATPGVFSAVGNNADNGNQPNSACRCNCNVPFCGDGISDNLLSEECDDGTTANAPGKFCNKEKRCIGGENGCTDANGDGRCGSDAAENASRLAAAFCAVNNDCVKGTCGTTACVQNTCGDGILAGNEICDDGNTVPANTGSDTCGVSATTAAGLNAILKPGCSTTVFENDPKACIAANCISQLCGDGVTNSSAGEMCDGGFCVCVAPALNAGSLCTTKSACKPPLAGSAADLCSVTNPVTGGLCNRNDIANHCRTTCMPPTCGDGVSDAGDQCEPPASGTFCRKNALGACVLNVCGDDDVCNKSAIDASTGLPRNCVSGPLGGVEQCDDSNTVNPNATNTDSCFSTCAGAACGDGVTEAGEQCDSVTMGCSNMAEDLSVPEQAVDCCIDGNVVDTNKALLPGLITVEQAYTALLGCRLPNLIGAAACDARLQKAFQRVQNRVLASQVYLENNDISRARRVMRSAETRLNRLTNRVSFVTRAGGACAASGKSITNQKANAANIAIGIVAHLIEDNPGFGN